MPLVPRGAALGASPAATWRCCDRRPGAARCPSSCLVHRRSRGRKRQRSAGDTAARATVPGWFVHGTRASSNAGPSPPATRDLLVATSVLAATTIRRSHKPPRTRSPRSASASRSEPAACASPRTSITRQPRSTARWRSSSPRRQPDGACRCARFDPEYPSQAKERVKGPAAGARRPGLREAALSSSIARRTAIAAAD